MHMEEKQTRGALIHGRMRPVYSLNLVGAWMFTRHVRHRLTAYCDGELAWAQVRKVEAHLRNCPSCQALCDEIRAGAQWAEQLHRVSPPDGLWESVAREIRKPAHRSEPLQGLSSRSRFPRWPAGAAFTAGAIVTVVAAVLLMPAPERVSAADLLKQAEDVVGTMVQPGQVLHRRWSVRRTAVEPGAAPQISRWTMDVWHTGKNLNGSVSRLQNERGELMMADARLETPEGPRSYSYFSPLYPREPRGVTIEWFSDAERRSAVARLPPGQRELLERITRVTDEPLVLSESRNNRALIENPGSLTNAVVRREVSLVGGMEQSDKVFRVRVVYPRSPSVDWLADGTMTWSTSRVETICSIDARSHLASKYDSQAVRADGGRLAYLQELQLLRAEWPTADLAQVFRQSIPPGTPTRRIDAYEYLSGYAREAQASWPR
jgi:hypothetical protein